MRLCVTCRGLGLRLDNERGDEVDMKRLDLSFDDFDDSLGDDQISEMIVIVEKCTSTKGLVRTEEGCQSFPSPKA